MGVLDALIISSCLNFSGQSKNACDKALEAGTKQSGIESNMNNYEKKLTKDTEDGVKEYLGNTTVSAVAATATIAQTIITRSASVKLPTFGLCNSFTASVNSKVSSLGLEWKF